MVRTRKKTDSPNKRQPATPLNHKSKRKREDQDGEEDYVEGRTARQRKRKKLDPEWGSVRAILEERPLYNESSNDWETEYLVDWEDGPRGKSYSPEWRRVCCPVALLRYYNIMLTPFIGH